MAINFPNRTILVVDNEKGFHGILRLVLEPYGFDLASAFDGQQGWERFTSRPFDLVISDVRMPKMQGPELLENIHRLKPSQPVIMMTSGSDPEGVFERRVQEENIAGCLYKPFEIDEVIRAVEHCLGIKLEEQR
jgi:DNA-binding NtrC family response regulator